MPFLAIQKLRDLVNTSFRVNSRADRDILIDLAAAQQHGLGLTMKQLVILQSGSATTTRRRIRNLVALGKVVRLPNSQDGRSEIYGVSDQLWNEFSQVQTALKWLLDECESRGQTADIIPRNHKPSA